MIRQGQGLAFGDRQVGVGRGEGVGLRIPGVGVFEDAFGHTGIVDDARGGAAVDALEWIDLVADNSFMQDEASR